MARGSRRPSSGWIDGERGDDPTISETAQVWLEQLNN
jgi:hypothetical protein